MTPRPYLVSTAQELVQVALEATDSAKVAAVRDELRLRTSEASQRALAALDGLLAGQVDAALAGDFEYALDPGFVDSDEDFSDFEDDGEEEEEGAVSPFAYTFEADDYELMMAAEFDDDFGDVSDRESMIVFRDAVLRCQGRGIKETARQARPRILKLTNGGKQPFKIGICARPGSRKGGYRDSPFSEMHILATAKQWKSVRDLEVMLIAWSFDARLCIQNRNPSPQGQKAKKKPRAYHLYVVR